MSDDDQEQRPRTSLRKGFAAIDAWHADIEAIPVMDAGESARLCALAQAGDRAARERVIEGNVRLVEFVAARYRGAPLPLEDRIQEGMFGLLAAVEKFDPRRGRFSTCAVVWIRQAVERGIDDRSRLVRRPAYVEQRLRSAKRWGETPRLEPGQLVAALQVDWVGSLDVEVAGDAEHGATPRLVGELVVDEGPGPEELVADADARVALSARVAAVLPPRLRLVLTLRYGLDGYTDAEGRTLRSLEEVGRHLGITRERVRQLEAKALETLRARLTLDRDGLVVVRKPRRRRGQAKSKAA